MSAKGAVFDAANVVFEQSDLNVPESPFLSPRIPTISGQMCNVICCTRSKCTYLGISIMSSDSPHLENSRSKLLSEAMVDVSRFTAQRRMGQYWYGSMLAL